MDGFFFLFAAKMYTCGMKCMRKWAHGLLGAWQKLWVALCYYEHSFDLDSLFVIRCKRIRISIRAYTAIGLNVSFDVLVPIIFLESMLNDNWCTYTHTHTNTYAAIRDEHCWGWWVCKCYPNWMHKLMGRFTPTQFNSATIAARTNG